MASNAQRLLNFVITGDPNNNNHFFRAKDINPDNEFHKLDNQDDHEQSPQ